MLHAAAERDALGRAGDRIYEIHLVSGANGDRNRDPSTIWAKPRIVEMAKIRYLDFQDPRRCIAPRDVQRSFELPGEADYFPRPPDAEIHCRSPATGRDSCHQGQDLP